MKKLKIYLDTSVISFIYADDAPEYQKVTIDFFNNYLSEYDVFISEIVYLEISKTKNINRKNLFYQAIEKYNLRVFAELNYEIEKLAKKYIDKKIIPENKFEDDLHIAYATYFEFDILLSWNFKHLANYKKQLEGYTKELNLFNPMEVLYEK